MRGEDEHAGIRKAALDHPRRVEALGGVCGRHADVDDGQLRLMLAHEGE